MTCQTWSHLYRGGLMMGLLFGLLGVGQAVTAQDLTTLVEPRPRIVSHIAEADQPIIRIAPRARNVATRPLPVTAGKLYRLTLKARIGGDFTVEKNARAHILTLQSHRWQLGGVYRVSFVDDQGKPVTGFGYGGQGFILTGQWHDYITFFHVPDSAVAAVVQLESNAQILDISALVLTEADDLSAVNLNPDFAHGELNYAGWSPSREGRLYTRPDGSTVFHPGYGGSTGPFPLEAGIRYQASATGQGGTINIVYYDAQGKQLNSRFLLRPGDGKTAVDFTPPDQTRWGRLVTYGIDFLEDCRIIKADD